MLDLLLFCLLLASGAARLFAWWPLLVLLIVVLWKRPILRRNEILYKAVWLAAVDICVGVLWGFENYLTWSTQSSICVRLAPGLSAWLKAWRVLCCDMSCYVTTPISVICCKLLIVLTEPCGFRVCGGGHCNIYHLNHSTSVPDARWLWGASVGLVFYSWDTRLWPH